MSDTSRERLIPIWEQHRNRILRYGHALYAMLPDGDPPVTIHGRDLRPADEGVGFQFQYTSTGAYYNGEVTSACFVVQIELVERNASVSAKVDAAPLLGYGDGHYEVFGRREAIAAIGNQAALREYFALALTPAAGRFFETVRAGQPIDEIIAGIAEPRPRPQK